MTLRCRALFCLLLASPPTFAAGDSAPVPTATKPAIGFASDKRQSSYACEVLLAVFNNEFPVIKTIAGTVEFRRRGGGEIRSFVFQYVDLKRTRQDVLSAPMPCSELTSVAIRDITVCDIPDHRHVDCFAIAGREPSFSMGGKTVRGIELTIGPPSP